MAGFFSKLFGGGGKKSDIDAVVEATLSGILEKGGFDLEYNLTTSKKEEVTEIKIDFSGADEELLKDHKGQLLDAFQLIVKRVTQHNFPDVQTNVLVDCGGYREESEAALIERAEHLKTIAIEQGKSVYYRALPPKERKVVHQYLAQDARVKSRSLGDGLYKKIKIFPVKNQGGAGADDASMSDEG
ncbi:protein jag [Pseudobdellovibrio sp. HCB154]|uniref:Jag family protein n=1 Tax=Pseudobdellovibrio sp. HCB154 TaxID=3386277 RepID=UPI00391742ED